jgi:hypothetical protein
MARAKKTTTRKKKAARKRTSTKKPTPRKAAARKAASKKAAAPKSRASATKAAKPRDPRLPPACTVIEKTYKGKALQVEVLEAGFRFEKKVWTSLTAIAKAVTGAKSINGPLFFGIAKRAQKTTGEER